MILQEVDYKKIGAVASRFSVKGKVSNIEPIIIGHINSTYRVTTIQDGLSHDYILQRINIFVFKRPYEVMSNIKVVCDHLSATAYDKLILTPIAIKGSQEVLLNLDETYWRMYPFISNTITYNKIDDPSLAYETAYTFGEYSRYLSDLNPEQLHETIIDFHNTPLRYDILKKTVADSSSERLKQASLALEHIERFAPLLKFYPILQKDIRAVHYDTKVNNILIDEATKKPICIIDLDTLMPGMLSYDLGDMVRTMVSPVDENEKEIDAVIVREEILDRLYEGFVDGLEDAISKDEKEYLFHGAGLIIYEQAIRFLNDFLSGDIYYPTDYEDQNLNRAKNQLKLLSEYVRIKLPEILK